MEKRIATITSKPHSGILDEDSLIVKFDNWVLYNTRFSPIVEDFIKLNNFYFISCSRVDFCADFNEFNNNMNPKDFIRKYMFRKFLKTGKAKGVTPKFDQGEKEHLWSGLKFGSNLSEITYYLYNKSKELREVLHKPWIVETWIKGGLRTPTDPSDRDNDVWRLEFSLKSGTKLIASEETGEIDLFLTLDIMKADYIAKCFYLLYQRYFCFVWNDGQCRKDRMRVLKLFKHEPVLDILVNSEKMRDATRSDKIFIKKLHEMNNELRGRDFFMSIEMDKYKQTIIEDTGLQSWAMYHGLHVPNNTHIYNIKDSEVPARILKTDNHSISESKLFN